MSDLKELTQRLIDGINQANLDVIDELMDDDFVEHEELPLAAPGGGGGTPLSLLDDAQRLPAFRCTNVEDMLQDGDKVVIRSRFSGNRQAGR